MNNRRMIIIFLSIITFILIFSVIVIAQHPSIPSQSPIGGGWTDDGIVVRLTNGTDKVGIGTNSPITKLDVVGNIRISDGTEGAGKVLTSDEFGVANRQELSESDGSNGIDGNGTTNFIPLWITDSSLGNSNMKMDSDGNFILKPGNSIIAISSDGSSCWRFSGTGVSKLVPPCPS